MNSTAFFKLPSLQISSFSWLLLYYYYFYVYLSVTDASALISSVLGFREQLDVLVPGMEQLCFGLCSLTYQEKRVSQYIAGCTPDTHTLFYLGLSQLSPFGNMSRRETQGSTQERSELFLGNKLFRRFHLSSQADLD